LKRGIESRRRHAGTGRNSHEALGIWVRRDGLIFFDGMKFTLRNGILVIREHVTNRMP
jgi:hypothetical protein